MLYLAIFRTHLWDDSIAALAERFRAACPSGDFIVLYDETRAASPLIPGFVKLAHTADTTHLGVPEIPVGRSLWYNADYALYIAHAAYPDYDYYILSEYDVAVNADMDGVMRGVSERGIDLVAHEIMIAPEDWGRGHWYKNAIKTFSHPFKAIISFIVVSRRALLVLLQGRRDQAKALPPDRSDDWPYCESFIPSVLRERSSMVISELSEWVQTDHHRWRPFRSVEDARTCIPGSIAHPVVGPVRFLQAMLDDHPAREYFIEGTFLHGLSKTCTFADVRHEIRSKLVKERDFVGLELWLEACHRHHLLGNRTLDLAYCKPALTSSVSPWSHSQDPAIDAAGANGPDLPEVGGFHTAEEFEPWWQVDLLDEYLVDTVTITNRADVAFRFRRFAIHSSNDGNTWVTRHSKMDDSDVSSDADAPWSLHFADPFVARYVRVQMVGIGMLHLRRIQVFGRAISAPAGRESYDVEVSQIAHDQDSAANGRNPMSGVFSPADLTAMLSALDNPEVRDKLSAHASTTVLQSLFGRRTDSFDVDQLQWLVAGITSGDYALERMAGARRQDNNFELLSYALSQVSMPGLFLEFGVFSGTSINHAASVRPDAKFYGFDSFEGLPETWRPGFVKGAFAVAELPAVRGNVELVRGWFDRTLPAFCDAHPGEPVAFLHVDCDLYSSTQTVFSQLNTRIVPGTIIVFDEYFNYPGWQLHEVRAFAEYCRSNAVTYQYIGLVPHHQQVAVRITGRG